LPGGPAQGPDALLGPVDAHDDLPGDVERPALPAPRGDAAAHRLLAQRGSLRLLGLPVRGRVVGHGAASCARPRSAALRVLPRVSPPMVRAAGPRSGVPRGAGAPSGMT